MTNDPKTCTSESVTFETGIVPVGPDYKGKSTLTIHCPDCGKYAQVIVEAFDERATANAWNAHHAHQLAERIREIGG